jgi:hypothetical protein
MTERATKVAILIAEMDGSMIPTVQCGANLFQDAQSLAGRTKGS